MHRHTARRMTFAINSLGPYTAVNTSAVHGVLGSEHTHNIIPGAPRRRRRRRRAAKRDDSRLGLGFKCHKKMCYDLKTLKKMS